MAEMVTGDNFSTVVAIKLLHSQWADHEEILMRSRDEARLLGRLRHRSIVRVEDLTYIQGHCAVIMEYLEGADLKSLMGFVGGRGAGFPTRTAFEVTAQVASALEAAYNYVPLQGGEPLRLVHRDIKPSNVMLTVDGDVKLLDFGTARANFDSREAHTESLAFGSQAYMAPERFMGDPDAPAGDIFSLGVSLYELLAGQNIGRILLREDRFFENLDERLAALNLDAMPEADRHAARKVMRLMMDFHPENRPTAGQVVELMEVLAEKCDDASMRRFSRQEVRPALEASPHEPGENSLQGNTLVEDRSATFDTAGFQPQSEASEDSEMMKESPPVSPPVEESPASTFPVDTDAYGDEEEELEAPPPEEIEEPFGLEERDSPAMELGEFSDETVEEPEAFIAEPPVAGLRWKTFPKPMSFPPLLLRSFRARAFRSRHPRLPQRAAAVAKYWVRRLLLWCLLEAPSRCLGEAPKRALQSLWWLRQPPRKCQRRLRWRRWWRTRRQHRMQERISRYGSVEV